MKENKLLNQILKESRLRSKIKDKSILDEDNLDGIEEVYNIIDNYMNKRDLARKFVEAMPIYYDDSNIWWRWREKKKRWEICDEIDILNILDICAIGINTIKTKDRVEIINSLKQQARKQKPLLPKRNWIQFNNEIIDLETGERFEATSKYFISNPIPHNLGRSDETPIMDKIFEEWVGKDHVKTLYEILAYCTLPDYPLHRIFCFIGGGMNGKSCFLNLLRKFVGNYNCCSTELDVLLNSRFEITRLHKKLTCLMGETNFNEMRKTSILKKLTGGDFIGFEYKNKKPFEDLNYAKIIIATNNLPTTDDKTLGFYRRWLIIDFPNQFSEKKDILADIPDEEYENLAMKCVSKLIGLLENKEFHNEGDINERATKYENRSDPLQKFLETNIEEDFSSYISKSEFMKKLIEWLKENRFRELAENTVGKKMKEKGYQDSKKYVDWLHDGKGGQMRIWNNIKWK